MIHGPMCPSVKSIEYHADGVTVKRVEFVHAGYGAISYGNVRLEPTTPPTIAELEAIFNSEDDRKVWITPDGSVAVNEPSTGR
jgi:hypothetical protein